jgi:hypothetical protein
VAERESRVPAHAKFIFCDQSIERTNSWHNAHKKLMWCTERVGRVVDFWVAFSDVVILVRRLIREGWIRYRWEGDLTADHDLSAQALSDSAVPSEGVGYER